MFSRNTFRISRMLLAVTALIVVPAMAQTTFLINSVTDNANEAPGNGECATGEALGLLDECTLRAAIEEANLTTGDVVFEIADYIATDDRDRSIIEITSPLPPILRKVTIDGRTHPDHENDRFTHLVIVGVSGVESASGLVLVGASGSMIRNIGITGFGNHGLVVSSGGNYTIRNNILGGGWVKGSLVVNPNGGDGLVLANASSTGNISYIENNLIFNNGGNGITVADSTGAAVFQDNIIGLRPHFLSLPDSAFRPTNGNGGHGIFIAASAATGNSIGFFSGNTIANNDGSGIMIEADDQNVFGNHIGLTSGAVASGYEATDYGNSGPGIQVLGSENTIGTSGAGRNNIGNNNTGIVLGRIESPASEAVDNVVAWNWIGTNADGDNLANNVWGSGIELLNTSGTEILNNQISNHLRGISVNSGVPFILRNTITNNSIGVRFAAPGQLGSLDLNDANIIGLNSVGVSIHNYLHAHPSALVAVRNNYIGTNAAGDNLGNTAFGVVIGGDQNRVWIGQDAGSGNVFGFSGQGAIRLIDNASGVLIAGNHIGVHPNGQIMGNNRGIQIGHDGSNPSNNQIGYGPDDAINPDTWTPGTGLGNVIAYNLDAGILVAEAGAAAVGNHFRGNQFIANAGEQSDLGIDLGMTEIDPGGDSSGPNNQLNWPDFDVAQTNYDAVAGEVNYRYRVQTTPVNADFPLTVDFYLTDSNVPQGKRLIGSDTYSELETFFFKTGSISVPANLAAGRYLVAIATDASGNTSQFTMVPAFLDDLPDELFSDRFETP